MLNRRSQQVNDAGSPVSLVEPLPPASQLSQPPLIASRPKQTILNDVGWSTPQSEKNQPGKYTNIMQLARPIWPQAIVANCGSYEPNLIEMGGEAVGMELVSIVGRRFRIRRTGESGWIIRSGRVCSEMHNPLDAHKRTFYSGGHRGNCVRPSRFRRPLNSSRNPNPNNQD